MESKKTWIYERSKADMYRYVLGRPGKNPLFVIGVNPSIASPTCLGNKVRRVSRFAIRKGFDGWIMLNLYPQRATDPNRLHAKLNVRAQGVNMGHIRRVLGQAEAPTVWVAWGNLIDKRPYLRGSAMLLAAKYLPMGCKVVCIGLTRPGHPRHPLYLKYSTPLEPFDLDAYVAGL